MILASLLFLAQLFPFPGPGNPATGGGAGVAFVQDRGDGTHGACNNGGTPSTTQTCAFSTPPTAGNTVLAVCYTYNTNCTISDNAGTDTYTQVTFIAGTGTGSVNSGCLESADTHKVICLWYAFNVAGSATLKATVAASSFIIMHQYEVSGLLSTASFDVTGSHSIDTSTSGPTSVTSATTAQANEFILNACAFENTTTPSFNSGGSLGTYTIAMSDTSVSTNVIEGTEQYSTVNTLSTQASAMTLSLAVAAGYTCTLTAFKHP